MTSLRNYVIIGLAVLSLHSYAQTTEMETRFNELSARFEVRDKLLLRDLKTYLQQFPYTTFAEEVTFMQGVLQAEKGQYKQSLKYLENVDFKALTRDHQADYDHYLSAIRPYLAAPEDDFNTEYTSQNSFTPNQMLRCLTVIALHVVHLA